MEQKENIMKIISLLSKGSHSKKKERARVSGVIKRLKKGCTTLMYACQQGLTEIIVKELRTKPEVVFLRDRSRKSVLHYCSGQRNLVAAASVAVAAPELLESADEDGFTPLHLAVIQGNNAMVNLLLANKADVNALDNEGHSVVHWATVCGEVEALRAVLAAGAKVTTPDINGGSPLHYAAQMCGASYEGKLGNTSSKLALEILDVLIAHPNSSVDVADKDGRQPLLWAASAGSEKAIISLLKAGARVESADKDGLTALHCAASRGHTECIDTIISLCGAPTDLIDSNGCTALHYAVTLGHADATARLLDLDANPNRQDRKGRTPAHCGCAKGQFETVKLLKEKGANLWLRNAKGDLPLHEAASSGRRDLVEWLLEQRPKQVNTTCNDGRTLLHIAASNDCTDMCKMLLDFGADVNSIFRNCKAQVFTPLDCALQKGHRSTAKFLQSNGGLPASKLHLSARRPNAFNDQELVKPLKYEKKDLQEVNTGKKYVIYIRNSDSECSCSEYVLQKQSKRHHNCREHRKRTRRRTSSCGEAEDILKDGDNSDISRSKSNIEIRRKSSRERSCSSSSKSEKEDSCENCCRHKKKFKRIKKRGKSKRAVKESVTYPKEGNVVNVLLLDESASRAYHPEKIAPPLSPMPPEKPKGETMAITSDDTKLDIDKSEKIESNNISEPDSLQQTTMVTEAEVHATEDSATQIQAHAIEAMTPEPEKSDILTGDIEETLKSEINSVLQSAANLATAVTDAPNKPEEPAIPIKVNDTQELDKNQVSQEPSKSDEHSSQVGDAKCEITEDVEGVSSNVALENTLAADSIQKLEILEPDTSQLSIPSVDKKEEAETLETSVQLPVSSGSLERNDQAPVQKKIEEPLIEKSGGTEKVDSTDVLSQTQNTAESLKQEGSKTEVVAEELDGKPQGKESRRSFTLISTPSQEEEESTQRKSSFTVLKSDESVEVEDSTALLIAEDRHSFQVFGDGTLKAHSQDEYTSDEADADDVAGHIRRIADGTSLFSQHAAAAAYSDLGSRKRRLKKRIKASEKPRAWSSIGAPSHQGSKDHDSGFEPSPRAMKTKIPTPRIIHTAIPPRRPVYATLDNRSCSSRLENRKLGDKNSCNMTAVTKSIQRNMRRYYMERKIFQHLLELKSLQIRSSKLNEAVLVKRAVDDYHKSCMALGVETGGTLRRYPYTEYTFKNFEMFLYETLKSLQKSGSNNFQNIEEVYQEAERRLSPDYNAYEKALRCTTKTHRCFHAAHAYTGIPCAAYIPWINHHTIPKYGFGPYKKTGIGSFYLPKILTGHSTCGSKVSLELSHGKSKQLIPLPSEKLDSNKRYYVTFTVKGSEAAEKGTRDVVENPSAETK